MYLSLVNDVLYYYNRGKWGFSMYKVINAKAASGMDGGKVYRSDLDGIGGRIRLIFELCNLVDPGQDPSAIEAQ